MTILIYSYEYLTSMRPAVWLKLDNRVETYLYVYLLSFSILIWSRPPPHEFIELALKPGAQYLRIRKWIPWYFCNCKKYGILHTLIQELLRLKFSGMLPKTIQPSIHYTSWWIFSLRTYPKTISFLPISWDYFLQMSEANTQRSRPALFRPCLVLTWAILWGTLGQTWVREKICQLS